MPICCCSLAGTNACKTCRYGTDGVTVSNPISVPMTVPKGKHGKWQSWEQDKPPYKWYSCDYCGFHALSKSNFCPNCGAKMEADSEQNADSAQTVQ